MSEDWNAIAAEVDAAIRSVGDVSQPDGYPATLRRAGASTGDPWNPTAGTPGYTTLRIVDTVNEARDRDGTLIGETRRTLLVAPGAGVAPTKADQIAVGITADEAGTDSAWLEILEVRPLSPAGIDLLYEVDVAF